MIWHHDYYKLIIIKNLYIINTLQERLKQSQARYQKPHYYGWIQSLIRKI